MRPKLTCPPPPTPLPSTHLSIRLRPSHPYTSLSAYVPPIRAPLCPTTSSSYPYTSLSDNVSYPYTSLSAYIPSIRTPLCPPASFPSAHLFVRQRLLSVHLFVRQRLLSAHLFVRQRLLSVDIFVRQHGTRTLLKFLHDRMYTTLSLPRASDCNGSRVVFREKKIRQRQLMRSERPKNFFDRVSHRGTRKDVVRAV